MLLFCNSHQTFFHGFFAPWDPLYAFCPTHLKCSWIFFSLPARQRDLSDVLSLKQAAIFFPLRSQQKHSVSALQNIFFQNFSPCWWDSWSLHPTPLLVLGSVFPVRLSLQNRLDKKLQPAPSINWELNAKYYGPKCVRDISILNKKGYNFNMGIIYWICSTPSLLKK